MRPRVIPAENPSPSMFSYHPARCFNEAAGNPRGKPVKAGFFLGGFRASMRPRVIPAENRELFPSCRRDQPCFNEAAGNPRGKLAVGDGAVADC